MQKRFSQPITFIGKSLFWSVLLYMACMMVINWDDMSAHFNKQNANIVQVQPTLPANPVAVIPVTSPQINDDANHAAVTSVTKIIIDQVAKAITSMRK